jgi:Ca2+-binding EF-hand superfamily protein
LKEVFVKLHKIIVKHGLSLKKVFNDFDKQRRGSLNFQEFKVMVQKMCKDISDEEAKLAFKMIDEDDSDSLEFAEMDKHYQLNIQHLER